MMNRLTLGIIVIVMNLGLATAAAQAAFVSLPGVQGKVNVVEYEGFIVFAEGGYFVDVL